MSMISRIFLVISSTLSFPFGSTITYPLDDNLPDCAAYSPAALPKTIPLAVERPPILFAPCIPPVISPAAYNPGTPVYPYESIQIPPFEACANIPILIISFTVIPYF